MSNVCDEIKTHLQRVDNMKTIISQIPPLCKSEKCIVGIDEAGRGPVLGQYRYTVINPSEANSQITNART